MRENVSNGTVYNPAFKARMVQRLLSPNAPANRTLSREVGVPESTLSRWRTAATLGAMPKRPDDDKRAPRPSTAWTAKEKLAVVLEAAAVPDADLGEFLRRKGVHEAELRQWREQALAGLQGGARSSVATKATTKAAAQEARRVRELERELQRKDKALAEAAALLILKKKVQEIWGGEDDDTDPTNEK
jgi:transposase